MVVTRVFIRCLLLLAIFVSPLAQANAIDDILERGTLRVGIAEFVPWAMPTKIGGHKGHDIDLGVKIAKEMGVRADFKVYEWKDIIPVAVKGAGDIPCVPFVRKITCIFTTMRLIGGPQEIPTDPFGRMMI